MDCSSGQVRCEAYVLSQGWKYIYFASETKAFVQLPGFSEFSTSITRVPPGCYLTPDGLKFYFGFDLVQRFHCEADVDKFRYLLESAIRKRLMSDVPIGTFLSGGVDSGIVTAIAHKLNPNVEAFTIGIPGSTDVDGAKKIAKHLGIKHHIYYLGDDELNSMLEGSVWLAESFSPVVVVETTLIRLVARLAKQKGFSVLLSGAGADEYLGGYPDFANKTMPQVNALSLSYLHNLHSTELRMLDLGTMCETVEAREPFLDVEMVRYGINLPMEALFNIGPDGKMHNKFILRQAADKYFPTGFAWFQKTPMCYGAGAGGLFLRKHVEYAEFEALKEEYPHLKINSLAKPEFFLKFREHFGEAFCKMDTSFALFGTYPGVDELVAVSASHAVLDVNSFTDDIQAKMFKEMLTGHVSAIPTLQNGYIPGQCPNHHDSHCMSFDEVMLLGHNCVDYDASLVNGVDLQ